MEKVIVRRVCNRSRAGLQAPLDTRLPADLHPVLARVYAARNITQAHELDRSFGRLHPPGQLKGLEEAATLLSEALHHGRRLLVVADFDADGATSCALAVRALRSMGAGHVDYIVPNRFEFGYGLTPEIVEVAARRRPDLIITVDNGISSIEGVAAARRRGIQVLVTDHHLPGAVLPEAEVIVNPNQPGDPFPSRNPAGVGVIFYVMLALRARLRGEGWFERPGVKEPKLAGLLDLVALGTVADVVPLDQNNRILVAQGLERIRRGECCSGIQALLNVAGRDRTRVVAADLGYALGPRLNAAGRLEDMSLGIECLLSDDKDAACAMARRLDELNRARRAIEGEMQEQALRHLAELSLERGDETLPLGLCLYDRQWHQGVIGILASRVKDRLHRPVIAFASADSGEIKGSARSVPGLHIRDALDAIAARQPGMLLKFGGHAMAAGLTLQRRDLHAFAQAFDGEVARHLTRDDLRGVVLSDGELVPDELSLEVAEVLRDGGPWGQGFPEPVFDGRFDVVSRRIVGDRHLKLVLRPAGHDRLVDAIAFNAAGMDWPEDERQVAIAYRLDVNEYRGRRSPQMIVEHVNVTERRGQADEAVRQE